MTGIVVSGVSRTLDLHHITPFLIVSEPGSLPLLAIGAAIVLVRRRFLVRYPSTLTEDSGKRA
jgi:hypothetical protein